MRSSSFSWSLRHAANILRIPTNPCILYQRIDICIYTCIRVNDQIAGNIFQICRALRNQVFIWYPCARYPAFIFEMYFRGDIGFANNSKIKQLFIIEAIGFSGSRHLFHSFYAFQEISFLMFKRGFYCMPRNRTLITGTARV